MKAAGQTGHLLDEAVVHKQVALMPVRFGLFSRYWDSSPRNSALVKVLYHLQKV